MSIEENEVKSNFSTLYSLPQVATVQIKKNNLTNSELTELKQSVSVIIFKQANHDLPIALVKSNEQQIQLQRVTVTSVTVTACYSHSA